MKTVAIIDKYPILRKGLDTFIKSEFTDVRTLEADNIFTFQEKYPKEIPDQVIIAISQIPDSNNLSFIAMVKNLYPSAGMIVCDQKPVPSLIPHYLKAGADGYLSNKTGLVELKECISEVFNGKRYITNEIFNILLEKLPNEMTATFKKHEKLTSREYEIAQYISQGMKTSLIAQTLGKKMTTISTTKRNVYKKLSVNNIIELQRVISGVRPDTLKFRNRI